MVKKTGFLSLVILVSFSSCASLFTSKSHYDDIDYQVQYGDRKTALEALQAVKESSYTAKDRVLYYLEEGMLYRYAGDYSKSNESLTKAEYAIEELLTKSISKGLLSGVLNDNALDYGGEDYEDIYINIFKALNYLQLDKTEEALIEIRRVNDKLNNLENKYDAELAKLNKDEDSEIPKADFHFYNDAFARYIGTLSYRLIGEFNDARIERDYLDQSYENQKNIYDFPKPTFPSLDSDKTYMNILSFTGFGPEKFPETININTDPGRIYLGKDKSSYIGFSTIGYSGIKSSVNIKLQFPRLVKHHNPVQYIELYINGIYIDRLETIESIDNVALETFKVRQPLIIGKTVIRAVSKAALSKISEDLVTEELGSGFGMLTNLVGAIYMQVSENSDLRISRYFPSLVHGLEVEVEPGIYNFTLKYFDSRSKLIHQEEFINKEIKKGSLNLFESYLMRKK